MPWCKKLGNGNAKIDWPKEKKCCRFVSVHALIQTVSQHTGARLASKYLIPATFQLQIKSSSFSNQ